ncbi:MAG TPA: diaminopimelate epimerase [Fimbriimonadaceae bacterium]|nr:diaminopimelate epimerase [Fimbriimonadaceae bacterium]
MIPFTKMHGIGNDFVIIDGIRQDLSGLDLSQLSKKVNDRRAGIGGDGLIVAEVGTQAPFRMRMFNPDGSESEMCGNGVRCLALYLRDEGHSTSDAVPLETGAGVLSLEIHDQDRVKVDMGPARLLRGEVGMTGVSDETFIDQPIELEGQRLVGTAVSMGNPHLVLFVEDAASVPLERWGPELEVHPLFPRRTNVHFVQVLSRSHLMQRTWERGAGATLACGTGACACGVAAQVTGRADRQVQIDLPGGTLAIEYREDGRVFMTGPAATVFKGEWTN